MQAGKLSRLPLTALPAACAAALAAGLFLMVDGVAEALAWSGLAFLFAAEGWRRGRSVRRAPVSPEDDGTLSATAAPAPSGPGVAAPEQPDASSSALEGLRSEVLALRSFEGIADRHIATICTHSEDAAGDILARIEQVESAMRGTIAYLREATGSDHVRRVISDTETAMERSRDSLAALLSQREADAVAGSQQMTRVKEQAQQLTSLVDNVRGLVRQTNMLAINAAIEASHAGNAGSFAVIARELKTLADDVDQLAVSIGGGVRRLHEEVAHAFEITSGERVAREREILDQVGVSMRELTGNLERLIAHQRDVIVKVHRENEELARPIMELAACIQFQDIVRQQLEQLRRSWRTVTAHLVALAAHDETAMPAGTLEQTIDALFDGYVMSDQRNAHVGKQVHGPGASIELF